MGHTRHRDTTPTISLKMCGEFFCLHGCGKTPAFTSICGQREGLHKAHHENNVWRWMTNSCVVSVCMHMCAHASNVSDICVCGVCMYCESVQEHVYLYVCNVSVAVGYVYASMFACVCL